MKPFTSILLIGVFNLLFTLCVTTDGTPFSGIFVWTETSLQRVLSDSMPKSAQEARICAARNEYESFQILLRCGHSLSVKDIILESLVGPNGSRIDMSNITIYRQHHFLIREPSHRNNNFRPGMYPDALIPKVHPLTKKPLTHGRFKAVPFNLPANETHGFWIDLYVPKGAEPGVYSGTVRLELEGYQQVKIPVSLTVWDFELPDVPSMHTAFGFVREKVKRYYDERKISLTHMEEYERQVREEIKKHKINVFPPLDLLTPKRGRTGEWEFTPTQITELRRYIDSYNLNAVQIPHPKKFVNDPQAEFSQLRLWLRAFDNLIALLDRPQVVFFIYLKDEPSSYEDYEFVRRWGSAIKSANTKVKVLVTEQTKPENFAWGDLYGSVDIWVALFPFYDDETAKARMKAGEMVWCYTALTQGQETPWWLTDMPLLNYRVPFWIAWRYAITGILYWGSMFHWQMAEDVWTDSRTHRDKSGKRIYHGEGNLVYPAFDVGFYGIVPSLRLKAIRDGIEDYEYMKILEKKGLITEARRLIMPLTKSWFDWEKDIRAYEEVRRKLAEMIMKAR